MSSCANASSSGLNSTLTCDASAPLSRIQHARPGMHFTRHKSVRHIPGAHTPFQITMLSTPRPCCPCPLGACAHCRGDPVVIQVPWRGKSPGGAAATQGRRRRRRRAPHQRSLARWRQPMGRTPAGSPAKAVAQCVPMRRAPADRDMMCVHGFCL